MSQPLNNRSDILRASIDEIGRANIDNLACLVDLSLQRLRTSPADRKGECCWVSSLYSMFFK